MPPWWREKLQFRAPVGAALAEANRPIALLEQVDDLSARAKQLLDKAEKAEKFGPAASAIREATRLVELLARLQGDLASGTTVTTTNILVQPQWVSIRVALLEALRPHPEAARAVGQALATLEASDAETS